MDFSGHVESPTISDKEGIVFKNSQEARLTDKRDLHKQFNNLYYIQ